MGAIGHDGLAVPGKVDLAHEPAFTLGGITIHPPTRQVVGRDVQQSVEPRVMQVLVALALAKGGIVTRDELTSWCWDGRIVGEDAINRTLSRIRQIAAGIGEGSFRIETIAKVGYRLIASDIDERLADPLLISSDARSDDKNGISRRQWVAGTITASAVALGGVAWWRSAYRPTPEAAEFYRKGVEARSVGLVGTGDQATAYFRQAVRADPDYAEAWGALARQLAGQIGDSGDKALDRNFAEVRSAAERALTLDPNQADAAGALAAVQPVFRSWRRFENGLLRVTRDHPGQHQATIKLGFFYSYVARWDDSIARFVEAQRAMPVMPGTSGLLVLAYWAAGRLEEAEAESIAALERWPRFHGTWFSRMVLLTYGGRPEQAVAFAQNPDYHPSGASAESTVALRLATAKALMSRNAAELALVRDRLLGGVKAEILNVPQAVRFFSALEERDVIFELLDAYFYRRGRFAAAGLKPIHPLSRISTDFLFHPTSRLLWNDPRFAAITRDIGLDDYWRTVGFVPVHRRR